MTTATRVSPTLREPQLLGQTVVVIGGSSEVGLKTAGRAGAEGADGAHLPQPGAPPARPRQPYRARLRRHTTVGDAARRPP